MTDEEIIAKANSFGGWYHSIELLPGFFTPLYRNDIAPQWDMIRGVRKVLDYKDKTVLDIGTMDGMWAFEAEKLGAKGVAAIDVWQGNYLKASERFAFAHEVLKSEVVFYNESVEVLREATAAFNWTYDIIQCPGVLYHLENPILALRNMRAACKLGGQLLLETAVWPAHAPMARFNSDKGIYDDPTTFWALSPSCLEACLRLAGWSPRDGGRSMKTGVAERHCFICDAT